MQVENHYFHCGEEWSDDDCDSFHNDRCPVCRAEIEPFESQELATGKLVHHPLSPDITPDLASLMMNRTRILVNRLAEVTGGDIEAHAGKELEAASAAKSSVGYALSDGDDPHFYRAEFYGNVFRSAEELAEAVEQLCSKVTDLRLNTADSAGKELDAAARSVQSWYIYTGILSERLKLELPQPNPLYIAQRSKKEL